MTKEILYYKQGDTSPELIAYLLDAKGKPLSNLDTATITFKLMHESESVAKVKSVVLGSAVTGQAKVFWEATDLSKVGTYYGEFKVVYADGTAAHIPNSDRVEIRVSAVLPEPA